MTGFSDRRVVVTGGTGALGTAVVAALVDAGAYCHIPNMHRSELERFPLADHPQVVIATGVDLAQEASVRAFYAGLPELFGSIHLAGGFAMSRLEDTTVDDLMRMLTVNLVTCFLCSREAVKRMRASRDPSGGRIVNVAARPALEPRLGAGMVPYTVAKAGVAALTEGLAAEVVGDGILVNAVVPSVLDTPANRQAMPKADFSRWPSCQEVARTVVFLASVDNQVSRGALVPVYGRS
jgi:NAD(P)-dependent dehydrogenase (short-subunit alcohol dehydrogenase family)